MTRPHERWLIESHGNVPGTFRWQPPLGEFFDDLVSLTLDDLGLWNDDVADYLVDLLTRFARTEVFHPASESGTETDGITNTLLEIQRVWEIDTPHFNPEREVELRRRIGDYTLFMSGFFWEAVHTASAGWYYASQGRRAYRFMADYHRALGQPEAAAFDALARQFDKYATALSYLRDVHLGAEYGPWPSGVFAKLIKF